MPKPNDKTLKMLYGIKKGSFQIACCTSKQEKILESVKGYLGGVLGEDLGLHKESVAEQWVVTDLATGQALRRGASEGITDTLSALAECRTYRNTVKAFQPEKYAAALELMKRLEGQND